MANARSLQQWLDELGLHLPSHLGWEAVLLRFSTERKIAHASGKSLT
jgi:hypothetical protein